MHAVWFGFDGGDGDDQIIIRPDKVDVAVLDADLFSRIQNAQPLHQLHGGVGMGHRAGAVVQHGICVNHSHRSARTGQAKGVQQTDAAHADDDDFGGIRRGQARMDGSGGQKVGGCGQAGGLVLHGKMACILDDVGARVANAVGPDFRLTRWQHAVLIAP